MLNYHRLFEKNVFYFLQKVQKVQKSAEKSKKYFTCISIKIGSISETFFTKMISVKSSTNPEIFIKFGRGRRIGWQLHMDTPIYKTLDIKIRVYVYKYYIKSSNKRLGIEIRL
jgi:hypothetical protein